MGPEPAAGNVSVGARAHPRDAGSMGSTQGLGVWVFGMGGKESLKH